MKKFAALVLALISLVPVAFAGTSFDLSGMSYDELVALKDQINLAIWQSNDWQEVEVPQGVWVIGKDIPAGKWTIKAVEGHSVGVDWGDVLDEAGTGLSWNSSVFMLENIYSKTSRYYDLEDTTEVTWDLQDGQYIIIDDGIAVFTPYSGKPSLGFK